mmetsp:Transcript_26512/g.40484  ORF Transcript_26512/g.40484 Transcript_26512/m.40484 type:complete len:83 (+) Transcript_26512:367-615(+)
MSRGGFTLGGLGYGSDAIMNSPPMGGSPGGQPMDGQHIHGIIIGELNSQKERYLKKEHQWEKQQDGLHQQIERLRYERTQLL